MSSKKESPATKQAEKRNTTLRPAGEGRRKAHQDRLLDMALEETFPASDPVSIAQID